MRSPARRRLRFRTLGDVLADAGRLAAGPHRQLGNWSLGQVCSHLATAMNLSVDRLEEVFRPPLLHVLVCRLMKPFVLRWGPPSGYRLDCSAAAALVPPPTEPAAGLALLRDAIDRLGREERRVTGHPLFGRFTRAQWDLFHLRHSELHLGFLVPAADGGG